MKKMIRQVSTVVDQPSPVEHRMESKRLKDEEMKAVEKLIDAVEQKAFDDMAKKSDKKEVEPEPSVEEYDDSYYYDEAGIKRVQLYSNKRRRDLAKKLAPLEIAPIIFHRRAEQVIPISSSLTIKVRETTGKEDVFMKDLIAKNTVKEEQNSKASISARFSLYTITFMLLEINGQALQDVFIKSTPAKENEVTEFNSKLDYISEFPDDFLELLYMHCLWFKDRVRRVSIGDIETF